MKQDIDQLVKESFLNRKLAVSQDAFERLVKKDSQLVVKKHRKLIGLLAMAASFVLFVFILNYNKPAQNIQLLPQVTKTKIKPKIKANQIKEVPIFKTKKSELAQNKIQVLKAVPKSINYATDLAINHISGGIDLVRKPHLKIQYKPIVITDAELDALLTSATAKLPKQKNDSISVDALLLLNELEIEINKPLPEKVMLGLKTGSKTIKSIINPKNN